MDVKPVLLLVDDEQRILRSISMVFKNNYHIYTAESAAEALQLMKRNKVHVILSDQRMPGMTGSELLKEVKANYPDTIRLLLTGYSELNAIINSINEGEVFRFISKPWSKNKLIDTVEKAAQIAIGIERDRGQKKTVSSVPVNKVIPDFMVLDKEKNTYDLIKNIVGDKASVFYETTVNEAIDTLSREKVAILISDLKLGEQDITAPISLLKQLNPYLVIIVMTEFTDTNTLVELINHGQIYRFLPKPARKGLLVQSLNSAIKNYRSMIQSPVLAERMTGEELNSKQKQRVPEKVINKIRNLRKKIHKSAEIA